MPGKRVCSLLGPPITRWRLFVARRTLFWDPRLTGGNDFRDGMCTLWEYVHGLAVRCIWDAECC